LIVQNQWKHHQFQAYPLDSSGNEPNTVVDDWNIFFTYRYRWSVEGFTQNGSTKVTLYSFPHNWYYYADEGEALTALNSLWVTEDSDDDTTTIPAIVDVYCSPTNASFCVRNDQVYWGNSSCIPCLRTIALTGGATTVLGVIVGVIVSVIFPLTIWLGAATKNGHYSYASPDRSEDLETEETEESLPLMSAGHDSTRTEEDGKHVASGDRNTNTLRQRHPGSSERETIQPTNTKSKLPSPMIAAKIKQREVENGIMQRVSAEKVWYLRGIGKDALHISLWPFPPAILLPGVALSPQQETSIVTSTLAYLRFAVQSLISLVLPLVLWPLTLAMLIVGLGLNLTGSFRNCEITNEHCG